MKSPISQGITLVRDLVTCLFKRKRSTIPANIGFTEE